MAQFQLTEVGTATVHLGDVSLDTDTVWRPVDETRVGEIADNILEGNWNVSPIEFPSLMGKLSGECFDAKACQLFNFGWCRGGAGVPMHKATHMWLPFCIAGRSNRS